MRPQVGQIVNNKYRLMRLIGDGGMGSVYEARHEVLGTSVALKFLHPELSRRSGLVQRFLQEARVSAQIQSAHVVRVTDVDQTADGLAFIVLEYLEGRTLQTLYEDLYRAGDRLSYRDGLEYALQMLEGVEAAHRAGVVHRDLKPDNVMITRSAKGEPLLKLLDFGIAKLKVTGELDRGLTRPGVVMGTPEYMAPEQAYSADAVDARADIFSLGVIVFEMLAGRRPVGGDQATFIASQYLQGNVARLVDLAPHVPVELANAIHRAMSPMAKDRFSSVHELRQAIEPFARAASVLSAGTSSSAGPAAAGETPAVAAGTPPTPAVPATTPPDGGERRSVPKTLPPADEPAAAGAIGGSEPAHALAPTPLGGLGAPTPLGGFSPSPPTPEPAVDRGGGFMPPTASALPLDGGATMGAVPATEHHGPVGPGGTDVGRGLPPFTQAAHPQTPMSPINRLDLPGTAPMIPLAMGSAATPALHSSGAAKTGGGISFAVIVALAAVISATVVGGVYFAHRLASGEDARDDPPPTPVAAAPTMQPTTPQPPQPTTTPAPGPVAAPKPPPPVPPAPRPTVTTRPTSGPTGTTTPPPAPRPTVPVLPGPLVIPGPTDIPLPPLFRIPGASTSQPGTAPAPTPTSTSTGASTSTRPRIIIRVPAPKGTNDSDRPRGSGS